MRRTNVYVTDQQLERLRARAEHEGVAMAEIIRRAIDAFLAWDDPTYAPMPKPQTRNGALIPRLKDGGFPAPAI
jgi:Ribbon-helix-helix protein, copG family